MVKPLIQPVQTGPVVPPVFNHDAVQVDGDLWMGAFPASDGVDPFFVGVIATIEQKTYPGKIGQMHIRFPFDDKVEKIPPLQRMHDVVNLASEMLKNGPLMIHSVAGRNRCGLIAALLLVKQGKTPVEALDLVRTVRPGALENDGFEAWYLENADQFGSTPLKGVKPTVAKKTRKTK